LPPRCPAPKWSTRTVSTSLSNRPRADNPTRLPHCANLQGACALPNGYFKCFLPSKLKRTCDTDEIDLETGLGCTERGRAVYATQETCCTSLLDDGEGQPGAWGPG
jgi:hypothetical protein